MMKNDEILMNFDQFVDIYSKLGVRRRSDGKISDFDRKQVDSLVELPVQTRPHLKTKNALKIVVNHSR